MTAKAIGRYVATWGTLMAVVLAVGCGGGCHGDDEVPFECADGKKDWAVDGDGDGYPGEVVCDPEPLPVDCDDGDGAIHPGAEEVCDGEDNDCDGEEDEGLVSTYYQDADGDGYGTDEAVEACTRPAGYAVVSGDCDDTNADIHPGATEVCDADETDEDCDGLVNEDDPGVSRDGMAEYYLDADGDGYGDDGETRLFCDEATALASGYVVDGGDCDDGDAGVNPGAQEVCDEADTDEDCNGLADDDDPGTDESTMMVIYHDGDGDGYGNPDMSGWSCEKPEGFILIGGDCWDLDETIYPGAEELCNRKDDDCDGVVDEGLEDQYQDYYLDRDGDGYGDGSSPLGYYGCPSPGYVTVAGDCDDFSTETYPGAEEICLYNDNDCDGIEDEGFVELYDSPSTCDILIRLPLGSFEMGSPEDEPGRGADEVLHEVELTRTLWVLPSEVTVSMWDWVMNGVWWKEEGEYDYLPQVSVTWEEALEFCNRLSELTGLSPAYSDSDGDGRLDTWDPTSEGYRLPTEAEWEYLIRAGTDTAFYNGDIDPAGMNNCDGYYADENLADIAYYCAVSGATPSLYESSYETHKRLPNTFGLYDMSGLAWEWVWDGYGAYPTDTVTDPVGLQDSVDQETGWVHATEDSRVIRGGSFSSYSQDCRSANRESLERTASRDDVGFRVVRNVEGKGV